jgi:hypothetical protein
MKKKQTSVEWLEFEINRRGPKEDNPPQWLKELFEQAKAMEKEQIMDAHEQAYIKMNMSFSAADRAEQYYNETFEA